jgi:hypothetical protein
LFCFLYMRPEGVVPKVCEEGALEGYNLSPMRISILILPTTF